jgi:hypothetical protein
VAGGFFVSPPRGRFALNRAALNVERDIDHPLADIAMVRRFSSQVTSHRTVAEQIVAVQARAGCPHLSKD